MAPNYGMSFLRRKKTKWRTAHPEGVASPTSPSMKPIFAGRGQVISGLLANRFGTNPKLLRGDIGPIATPNDYLNTVFDDVISLCENCRNNVRPRSPREKLKLVTLLSLRVKSLSRICYL